MSFTGKAPMNRTEAIENVEAMKRDTEQAAMIKLIKLALGPLGNLSHEAQQVYKTALDDLK